MFGNIVMTWICWMSVDSRMQLLWVTRLITRRCRTSSKVTSSKVSANWQLLMPRAEPLPGPARLPRWPWEHHLPVICRLRTHLQQQPVPAVQLLLLLQFQTGLLLALDWQVCNLTLCWWSVGPGYPLSVFFLPLSIHFLIFCSFLLFSHSYLIYQFFLLSIPSLSTRIVPLRLQAGGHRRWPNLSLLCFVYFMLSVLLSYYLFWCFVVFGLV